MARGLRSSTKRSGSNHLAPKKGKMPSPHASPGRAAGARATSTAAVSARPMGKSAGNSNGGRAVGMGGAMRSNPQSPMLGHNKR